MNNKVIVITGATSGIGLEIARHFASLKSILVINGIANPKFVDSLIADLKQRGSPEVIYSGADLAKPDDIKQMFTEIEVSFGRIDVLINNAGIQFVSEIENFPEEKWEEIIRINLIASFYTIKYAIIMMKQNNWGRIINISSAHGLVASAKKSAYVASKHGLIGLTKTVALESAGYNITSNAICPGYVRTPLVDKQLNDKMTVNKLTEEQAIKQLFEYTHSDNKFVKIEDIIDLIILLIKSETINGAALPIDVAWTAH
jgi:3-hydroxybutyrate dehydrogenase